MKLTPLILTLVYTFITLPADAAPLPPRIAILSPANGTAVYTTSAIYDVTQETIRVRGAFADVSQELLDAGVAILVNGSVTPADFSFTGSKTVDGVVYRSGLFQYDVPVVTDFVWPVRRYVAEIVDTKTFEAYARHQVSVYDLRGHSDATPFEPLSTEIPGMSIQLTDRGFGNRTVGNDEEINLEKTQRALLPQPSLKLFNDELTARARDLSERSRGPGLKRCVKLTKAKDENFTDTSKFSPYKKALATAKGKFRKYKIAKRACELLPNPAAIFACKTALEISSCVKKEPKDNDFNLCVDEIRGEAQALSINEIAYQGLNFEEATSGNKGLFRSHVTADGLEGSIDGYLRGLSVRWKNELCFEPPVEIVDDEYIEKTKWLDKWSSCKGMVTKDGSASTLLGDLAAYYQVKADPTDVEIPKVSLVESGVFSFTNASLNANRGTCKESFINADAVALLNNYFQPLREAFQSEWYDGDPNTMEATAFTKIFAPYKLGTIEHQNYDIFAGLSSLTSAPESGLQTLYVNTVTSTHPETLANQKTHWFYAPRRGIVFANDARDSIGRTFDISYTITTGMVNKILNMRTATPQGLNITYRPTWDDLAEFGVRRPSGASGEDRAVLNRSTLIQLDAAFINIGNKKLEIEISPILDPLVYMAPDLMQSIAIPNVGLPTTYGIDSLQITFKEKDKGGNRGKEWITFRGGFNDKGFNFSVTNKKDALFLKPNLARDEWDFNIYERPSVICRMNFGGSISGPSLCEDRIERKVARLIKKALRPIFIDLLSKVPAPQHFDGDGEVKKKDFYLTDMIRRQENQNITFYGVFD